MGGTLGGNSLRQFQATRRLPRPNGRGGGDTEKGEKGLAKTKQTVAETLTAYKQSRELERDAIISEFNGDSRQLAAEILRYRHAVRQIADAVGWIRDAFVALGPSSAVKSGICPQCRERPADPLFLGEGKDGGHICGECWASNRHAEFEPHEP